MDKPVSYGIGSGCHNIYDSNGNLICQVFENLKDRFEIVKAVNCHDDLLAALKEAEYALHKAGISLDSVRKALDKAEAP